MNRRGGLAYPVASAIPSKTMAGHLFATLLIITDEMLLLLPDVCDGANLAIWKSEIQDEILARLALLTRFFAFYGYSSEHQKVTQSFKNVLELLDKEIAKNNDDSRNCDLAIHALSEARSELISLFGNPISASIFARARRLPPAAAIALTLPVVDRELLIRLKPPTTKESRSKEASKSKGSKTKLFEPNYRWSKLWLTFVCSVKIPVSACTFTAFDEITAPGLINLWSRYGDQRMNSAYRLFFNNRIVTKCWLQLAILLNYLILSAPPLQFARVFYRGERTLPETFGDNKGLIRVDNIWAVTDSRDVATVFAGKKGIVYQIHLPPGFPAIPLSQLGLSEEEAFASEYEYLLPATLDAFGMNRTLAYRVIQWHKHSNRIFVDVVPEMLGKQLTGKPRSLGGKRPSFRPADLKVDQAADLKVNRFVGESSKELGSVLRSTLETPGNWHVWLREPREEWCRGEDGEAEDQEWTDRHDAILATKEMRQMGIGITHPALLTLDKITHLEFDRAKIQEHVAKFSGSVANILHRIT